MSEWIKYFTLLANMAWVKFVQCTSQMEPFIVGGQHTEITKFPHSVALFAVCDEKPTCLCGASVLNQVALLTAAHCVAHCKVATRETDLLVAYAGHENYLEAPFVEDIIDTIYHRDYDEETLANDLAVALLRKVIPLGERIKRVIIMRHMNEEFTVGNVAGWGLIDEEELTVSEKLVSLEQQIRSNETCAKIGYLEPGMFCAGSEDPDDPHPSSGDSGSALIANNTYQLGLVSFAIDRLPALLVYTNVTYYINWIHKTTHKLYCENSNNLVALCNESVDNCNK